MRHEGFAVVFADVAIGYKAGFAAQVAGELATVVVLDDDGVPGIFQDGGNGVPMQGNEPADLQLVGSDSLLGQLLTRFLDDARVDPQPIRVTSALAGPCSLGGSTEASMPWTLRIRFSIMARRFTVLVYSSLMSTPSSSCSSLETTWVWPGTPGTARGETPLSVIR